MAGKKTAPKDELSPRQEAYLKAAQDIAVKFIEQGRLNPAAFDETFGRIYLAVKKAVEDQE